MEQGARKCPYCGEEILAVAKKCKYCGEWLTGEKAEDTPKQMISCPICSEMIEEGTEICPHCHEKLTTLSNPNPAVTKPIKTEKEDDGTRSFFDYYLWDPFFRHYFDFKGRLNRKHYWLSILVWIIVLIALLVIMPVGVLFFLITIIPLYATTARRLRDADSSPTALMWSLIVSPLIMIWTCKPSEDESIRVDNLVPDTPQPVKFKKADVITTLILIIFFIFGLALNSGLLDREPTEEDDSELISTEVIDEETRENVKNAYMGLLEKYGENDDDMYICNYFLYDITGDGIPELWINSGTCEADYKLSVYTYDDGLIAIDEGTEGDAGHSAFLIGDDYILQVRGHMGYQSWSKITYNSGKLESEVVFEDNLNETGKEDYTEPSEEQVEWYSYDDAMPIVSMFGDFDLKNDDDERTTNSAENEQDSPRLLTVANVEYWDNVKDQGGNTYGPNNMLDGNPATAWAVNLEKASYDCDKLYGPTFTLRCKKLSHIVINNGYAKSDEAYKNNARASHIIFCNADNVSDEDEQASYLFEGILKDTPDKQTLNIDPNLSCNNDIKKIQLIIPIDGLRHGTKWNDLCVSEIEFWGY